ncbi:TPA: hypothetical protein NO555_005358 [Klebsiella variicola subsp. variicola]|nr:hypothetical protein [Klebsiella variicola subsp. variicola]HCI4627473.1 hypothetical protein [Klebsiella variicola subsp. variicola]HCI6660956.1 hypothetical protein [Klebsiella variicola subsp. variicola]
MGRGKNTVIINGEVKHIADLDHVTLCQEWNKLTKEIDALYSINKKANSGWKGSILKLLRINLPEKSKSGVLVIGKNSNNESNCTG